MGKLESEFKCHQLHGGQTSTNNSSLGKDLPTYYSTGLRRTSAAGKSGQSFANFKKLSGGIAASLCLFLFFAKVRVIRRCSSSPSATSSSSASAAVLNVRAPKNLPITRPIMLYYGDTNYDYMQQEEEWDREGLLDPAWEKQQKKHGRYQLNCLTLNRRH
ncbi:Alpha-actinin-1 [Trichinella spiralis]|uniref:Alpha-actinin-1 n=1 Tax=Trichinella spiralis TaxID=6334 RepID=A0A0V1ANV6_TRISP|nr:Alpha-actinin-1 [Trichinella spiralis]